MSIWKGRDLCGTPLSCEMIYFFLPFSSTFQALFDPLKDALRFPGQLNLSDMKAALKGRDSREGA